MLLAKKKNMTQMFGENNNVMPVTVLDYSECYMAKGQKNSSKDFVCIEKKKKQSKPLAGIYGEGNVPFLAYESQSEVMDELVAGDIVNLISISKGKGFAGVMRMWNFKGGKRTHGQSDRERHPGSIGCRTIPGRVYKGKKMGRRKGFERVTLRGLKVVSVDTENKLLCVKGSVPGAYNTVVQIVKR